MVRLILILLLMLIVVRGDGVAGVDVHVKTELEAFQCLKEDSYHWNFAIVRGLQDIGAVDPYACDNMKKAHQVGMASVDVYLVPCVRCGNPEEQVNLLVDALTPCGFGKVWLKLEYGQWGIDLAANRLFVERLVKQVQSRGLQPGIFTSYVWWRTILGLDYAGLYQLPLWWIHYDEEMNFRQYQPFGGWKVPTIKEFNGDQYYCRGQFGFNWHP